MQLGHDTIHSVTTYKILGLISPVVSGMGYIPYIVSILKGKTKPHPFSWFVWSLLGGLVLFFYYSVGARDTLPLAVLNFVGPIVILFFSLGHWEGGFSKFDYNCLVLSIAAVIFYVLYHNASLSLSISLFADFLAFLPTFRKSYYDFTSEDVLTWLFFFVGNLFSILAISRWSYSIALFPVYMAVMNGVNFSILYLRTHTLKKAR